MLIGGVAVTGLLQFGHDVSVVENEVVLLDLGRDFADASIWPRRQRRGERSSVTARWTS